MAYSMSDADKHYLRSKRLILIQFFTHPSRHIYGDPSTYQYKDLKENFYNLINYLVADNILSDDMAEEILAQQTNRYQVAKLLDILPRRGPTAFEKFIDAVLRIFKMDSFKAFERALEDLSVIIRYS